MVKIFWKLGCCGTYDAEVHQLPRSNAPFRLLLVTLTKDNRRTRRSRHIRQLNLLEEDKWDGDDILTDPLIQIGARNWAS